MSTRRPWAVGMSATCGHKPTCANIYEIEDGIDITFPCSGLSVEDAGLIVGAVNAISQSHAGIDAILAALEVEWRRVAELAAAARAAQGRPEE